MVRGLIRLGLQIVGNAVGLIVAYLILKPEMDLEASGFIIAVLIFTIASVVLQPLITKIAINSVEALQGGTALFTTFISLLITELVSDGLTLDGADTWLFATLIVWLVTMLAGIILPLIFLRKAVDNNR